MRGTRGEISSGAATALLRRAGIAPSRSIADGMARRWRFDWRTPCFDDGYLAADETVVLNSPGCRRLTLALVPNALPPIASGLRRRVVRSPSGRLKTAGQQSPDAITTREADDGRAGQRWSAIARQQHRGWAEIGGRARRTSPWRRWRVSWTRIRHRRAGGYRPIQGRMAEQSSATMPYGLQKAAIRVQVMVGFWPTAGQLDG